MKKIMTLLATTFLLFSCGKNYDAGNLAQQKLKITRGSIVGGSKVEKGFESVIGLADASGQIFCTGNLVASNQILTASHCIMSPQVSQMEAQLFFIIVQSKVNQYISAMVASNQLSKEDAAIKVKEVSFIKPLIKKAIKEHMQEKVLTYGIHIGQGVTGRSTVETKNNIIAEVIIPDRYVDSLFEAFFGGTSLYNPLTDSLKETVTPDQAKIILKEEITEVKPIAYIGEEEARKLIAENFDQVQLVGFGLKADQRSKMGPDGMLAFLKASLEKEGLTESEKEQLQKNIENLKKEVEKVKGLIDSSGDKYTAKIKVKEFKDFITASNIEEIVSQEQQENSLEADPSMTQEEIEEQLKKDILDYATNFEMKIDSMNELSGACFGDSGGPAFFTKPNGEIVQVGVIVAVNFCGKDTYIAPVKL